MDFVVAVPLMIGRETKQTRKYPDPKVQSFRLEEGAMSAIVKNNKNPDHESSGKNRYKQGQPVRYLEAVDHCNPKDDKWKK